MKVLFFNDSLGVGGAEVLLTQEMTGLRARGVEVSLVVNRMVNSHLSRSLIEKGIAVRSLSPASGTSLISKLANCMFRFQRKSKWNAVVASVNPDVIHLNGLPAGVELDRHADRLIYTFHTSVDRAISIQGTGFESTLKTLAREGMYFIGINKAMTAEISHRFSTNRVLYVPNAVDFSAVRHERKDKASFLKSLGIPGDSFILGMVGRLHPVKNHEFALEVFARLIMREPTAYMLVVGRDERGRQKKLMYLASELGIAERIMFLGERDDAIGCMSTFDAFIHTSFVEGFSLVALEAQVLGVRSVITDAVPDEVFCCSNCFKLSLNDSPERWANVILGENAPVGNSGLALFDLPSAISRLETCYRVVSRAKSGDSPL